MTENEKILLTLAHQILSESHRLVLPHHQNCIRARIQTFDEMQIHEIHATGINGGRFKTHLILLTHEGQKVSLTTRQTMEDVVIIDLWAMPANYEQMRQLLLETEEHRHWHHAPWLVINMLKKMNPKR